jgi:hypothetical protein
MQQKKLTKAFCVCVCVCVCVYLCACKMYNCVDKTQSFFFTCQGK